MHVTYTPKAHIFIHFALGWAVFELPPNFWKKCTKWLQNNLDMFKVKTTNATYTPRGLNFPPFRSMMSHFRVMVKFLEKCRKVHQNDLDMFNVKNTNINSTCMLYTPKAQIFVLFALQWADFWKIWPNFRKSVLNDKWPWYVQGEKYQHACYIHPQGPNFHPFRSTGCFQLHVWPNFRAPNNHQSAPNNHQMILTCQHACYIYRQGPNFCPFHSSLSRFWVMAQFLEKCTEWPQMTLTCSRLNIPTCKLHTLLRPKIPSISQQSISSIWHKGMHVIVTWVSAIITVTTVLFKFHWTFILWWKQIPQN